MATITKFKILVGILLIFLVIPLHFQAAQTGESHNFNVDSFYDLTARSRITATLRKTTPKLSFYIDNDWWDLLDYQKKKDVEKALEFLGLEFYYKIYPTLTSVFGYEWTPGIDNDETITVLIHPMIEEARGYFNSGDEYPKLQVPISNEREMIYLNANYITDLSLAKSFLAHEFVHLITFNQKDKLRGVSEETWLNEARAEYAPTVIGYDSEYEGSNLQKRVKNFLDRPYDSLTEWQNKPFDYGVANLFTQYLVDQYGIEILVDSLKSSKIGIPSLNEALLKRSFKEDFSKIFTDWTIAILINDCQISEKYCYKNQNLTSFHVIPSGNFLPLVGKTSLNVSQTTQSWAGNWYKFVGGWGNLKIEFIGYPKGLFKVPYITQDLSGNWQLSFFELDESQRGEILIPQFRTNIISVTIIPSLQTKISGFDGSKPSFSFSWIASVGEENSQTEESELVKNLLKQIEYLKIEIAKVQSQINEILAQKIGTRPISCSKFEIDLYFVMTNSFEVRCLQEFLKSQGSEIYPEGLVTGNFLELTQKAVIRFQERYASEILIPLGLEKGTGFVGSKTRAKINQLLGY